MKEAANIQQIDLLPGEILLIDGFPVDKEFISSLRELVAVHKPVTTVSIIAQEAIRYVSDKDEDSNPDLGVLFYCLVDMIENADRLGIHNEYLQTWYK